MRRQIALVLIIFGLSGCSPEPRDGLQNRKLLADAIDREIVVRELAAQSIPFRVDREGGIWYSPRDTASVDAVMSRVKNERSQPASSYESPDDMRRFKELLSMAGIPYQTVQRSGREWVSWEEIDDARVKSIQIQVEREGADRERRARESGATIK